MQLEQSARQEGARSDQSAGNSLIPSIALPKGGGAIHGIGEKFGANPVTGTASMTVPIATSASRFGPTLALSYDSGAGNGPFGLGWNLSTSSITRKTDKGLPQYRDAEESDAFILSDAEDLVPTLVMQGGGWVRESLQPATYDGVVFTVQRYRPRIEGLFARIEHWTNPLDQTSFWRTISSDNVTSLYGLHSNGRVVDPDDPSRIFKWLLQQSHDDKGNVIAYGYKAENRDGVVAALHESSRSVGAQRYLKFMRYGNTTPYYPDPLKPASLALPDRWYFQVIFDYGDHDFGHPLMQEQATWSARMDPFSSYRAGFEIRSHRLCRRVLMFHDFPELGDTPCLVRSTDLDYNAGDIATFLASAQHTAYRRNPVDQSYTILDPTAQAQLSPRSMPAVEFTYSVAQVDDTVRFVAADALENLPHGVDGTQYRWLDLDSEGSPGVLTEEAEGWYYKRNISNLPRDDQGNVISSGGTGVANVRAAFEPLQHILARPSIAALNGGRQQFVDLAGGGQQCLVQFERPLSGFYARNEAQEWEPYTALTSSPNIDWADPNLRMIDLDGDGFADILISHDQVFSWHASQGKQGFAEATAVRLPVDEDEGPALIFADGTQSIYLADFSGDGLTDLVRIRNGEICYWPNLGYGRFGPKITMSNAPLFDCTDQFNQMRVRLADIDGSGTTDIIYLGTHQVVLYFNQSGNTWSAPQALTRLAAPNDVAAVTAVDLLGNGTACLVWSSPLPGDSGRQMRYVDLMGGQKPHLLLAVKNNLGAETRVHYVASTRFYLQDRLAGTPWITRLPFPVHVVEKVETYDVLSRTRFATRYAYHHGYYDGVEREFRGFGMVEQWDSETFAAFSDDPAVNLDQAAALPPVLTRSWFHTGAYLQAARISLLFKDQYYREQGLGQTELDAMLLPDTVLPATVTLANGSEVPATLSPDEQREACRALKGAVLRQEVYALDGTPQASQPYSVSERNFTIRLLQPKGSERHAVFFTHARETVDYHYERTLYDINGQQLADPRVSHQMTLAVDAYGNPLKMVAVGYGRRYDPTDPLLRPDDIAKQKQTLVALSENRYTNAILDANAHRTPLPAEALSYELLKVKPQANLSHTTNLFRYPEMQALVQAADDGLHDIPYDDINALGATGTGSFRRLTEHVRTNYRRDDLSGPLLFGDVQPLALPFESYKLAFTPGLLAVFGTKISAADAAALLTGSEGGYQDLDGDGQLWIPSGRVLFSPDAAQPDPAFARAHRYLPQGAQDPFGNLSRVAYDSHELFVAQTTDALGSTVSAQFDYRVLQPSLVTDTNGNRTAVAFDVLGLLVATAVMGKEQEPDGMSKGDSLQGFITDLSDTQIGDLFDVTDPRIPAATLLGDATSRIIYDVDRYAKTGEPVFAAAVVRETHVADLASGQHSKVQVGFTHSDGYGREIQKKIRAEPSQLESGGASVDPRWVGSGWTIFNNKDKPVCQYEPFFTPTHKFEFAVQRGVSSTLFYDPATRVIATLHPNQTYEKVLFDPWWQQSWDVNDTITLDPATDPDVAAWFSRLNPSEYTPGWFALRTNPANAALAAQRWPDPRQRSAENDAANKAAAHVNTPGTAHLDTLGRTFLTIADNGADGKYATRVELDIEGNQRAVSDALDRKVMVYDNDMLGTRIHQDSIEAGERWMLNDATGKPIRTWDSRGHTLRTEYDALHRPLRSFVQGADPQDPAAEMLFAKTEYGEGQINDIQFNLRTKPFRQYDSAGRVTSEAYDFKGNPLRSSRQLAVDYKTIPDWSANPVLEPQTFTSSTRYDALNRPTTVTTPDASVYRPTFNEANLLETVQVNLRSEPAATPFVNNIDYDAKGQRQRIEYGNGVRTDYTHDPLTFRLRELKTTRLAGQVRLQDLSYAYDSAGNITHIRDDAQQTIYFNNQVVTPDNDYRYDAIYRLIHAQGREHIGQLTQPQTTWDDQFRVHLPQHSDGQTMRRYQEEYRYDAVGNFLQLIHQAANGNWTRGYAYSEPSLIEAGKQSNRLSSTTVGSTNPITETYPYDAHGNMLSMPHLAQMEWDFKDELHVVELGGGGMAYYVYDAGGQRMRKVVEKNGGTLIEERIYLDGFEVFRKRLNGALVLERETLHVMDDKQRIALVETKTLDVASPLAPQPSLIRFQLGNHLGSASLELDDVGHIISYEEYYPYGSTSYQAVRSAAEVSLKRYRYTGMERDEETGLAYHSARYYAPWLGRWVKADPSGLKDGPNLYVYVANKPTVLVDRAGLEGEGPNIIDVITYEARQAAFEAGKRLETGKVAAQLSGDVSLPAPKGEVVLNTIATDRWWRLAYSTAQGNTASTIFRENLTQSSATALWGESSQRLVPEPVFYEGELLSVGKNPGGQPKGARTGDVCIAKAPTSPVEWGHLTSQSIENPVFDLKVSNSYVPGKPAFEVQSGGLAIQEVRPWSKLPKAPKGGPKISGGSTLTGATVVQGTMIAATIWNLANARSPQEFVGRAASTATNVMASQIGETLGWYWGPLGAAAGATLGPVAVDVAKDPVGAVHATVDCVFGGNCPGFPTEEEVESTAGKVWNGTGAAVDYVFGAHWLDWIDDL